MVALDPLKSMNVRIGAETFALPLSMVVDVHDVGKIVPVAGAPISVRGLSSHRGRVTCLVSLADLLRVRSNPDALPMAVSVRWKNDLIALEVDAVEGIAEASHTLDINSILNSTFSQSGDHS